MTMKARPKTRATASAVGAVRPVVGMLTGSPEVRFEIVPGGHLGMLTGRAARRTTWLVMDEWVAQWSDGGTPPAASSSTSESSSKPTIGTNRKRRHSSSASRSLAK